MKYYIKKIKSAKLDILNTLALNAGNEGISFITTMIDEWNSGKNNFMKDGEVLFGAYIHNECIGIVGINIDPYTDNPNLGRVRHLYVSPQFRGQGVGRQILKRIIHHAELHFTDIRLYTNNNIASGLYETSGFQPSKKYKESHVMKLLKTTLEQY